ncbi:MAG: epoxyqueuosine reductase QueH [Acidobacteriota bacterium]|nr:epoxyqueuosine reductase QueH [Acidobacteriota bacterium]
MAKPPLLVHICCAPDAAYGVGVFQRDYEVTGFFHNPNIWPAEEYDLRRMEARKVESRLGFRLVEGRYDPEDWDKRVAPFASEPEKGRRCDVCYALRLDASARLAADMGCPAFATVLTVSPWKKADVINRIGVRLGRKYGLRFIEADLKKNGGFSQSVEISRRFGLYRQNYCGCRYSFRPH